MKIFKDDRLNIEFKEFGFVKIQLFNKSETNTIKKYLKEFIHKNNIKIKDYYSFPNENTPSNTCENLWSFFNNLLSEKIDTIFSNDYLLINSFLVCKGKRAKEMPWHTDSSYYDQKKFLRPFSIWSGIDKTTKKNGGFRVVPKSHKLGFNYQIIAESGTPWYKNERSKDLYKLLNDKYGINVPLDSGEVIIRDYALIHGSNPNKSFFKNRIGYNLTFFPKNVNEFKVCIKNTLKEKPEYRFYKMNKSDLMCNSQKFYYYSRGDERYPDEDFKNSLIETIHFKESSFAFKSLSEMEKIMNSPIKSLKSNFEI